MSANRTVAGVDDYRTAVRQLVQGCLRDPFLVCGVEAEALLDSQFQGQSLYRDRAAVYPPQDSAAFQAGQVPANGFRGDVEDLGQGVDVDTPVRPGEAENGLLPFGCVHVDSDVVGFYVSRLRWCGTPCRTAC